MDDETKIESLSSRPWILVTVFGAIFVAWIATPFVMLSLVNRLNEAGTLGDLFGSINALFSGLAFAGVIVAILLQKEELRFQREELKLTRAEQKRSTEVQALSSSALSEQAEVLKIITEMNGIAILIQSKSSQIEYITSAINSGETSSAQQELQTLLKDRAELINELESLMHAVRSAATHPWG
jgi:hypothetical protein